MDHVKCVSGRINKGGRIGYIENMDFVTFIYATLWCMQGKKCLLSLPN